MSSKCDPGVGTRRAKKRSQNATENRTLFNGPGSTTRPSRKRAKLGLPPGSETQHDFNQTCIDRNLPRIKPLKKPLAGNGCDSPDTAEPPCNARYPGDQSSASLDKQLDGRKIHTDLQPSFSVSGGDEELYALMQGFSSPAETVEQDLPLPTSAQPAGNAQAHGRGYVPGTCGSQDRGIFTDKQVECNVARNLPNFENTSEDIEEAMRLLADHVDQHRIAMEPPPPSWSDDIFEDIAVSEDAPEWIDATEAFDAAKPHEETEFPQILPETTPTQQKRSVSVLSPVSRNASGTFPGVEFDISENEYNDSDLDTSLVDLTTTSEEVQPVTPKTFPPDCSQRKLRSLHAKWMAPTITPRLPLTPEGKQYSNKYMP